MRVRINAVRRKVSRFVRHDERGTQLVELALVMPILVLLFAATAEFGRFFYTYSTLAKATRAGARYMTSKPINTTFKGKAQNLVVFGDEGAGCSGAAVVTNLVCANVFIEKKFVSGAPTVTVSIINFEYQPLFDLGKLIGSSTLSLKVNVGASSTMKHLL